MESLGEAAKATRPEGSPHAREGMDKWSEISFIKAILENGGFASEKSTVHQEPVFATLCDLDRYATMLWSFIGGTTSAGWMESDEERWDEAVETIKNAIGRPDGFQDLGDGKFAMKFVANIAIPTK